MVKKVEMLSKLWIPIVAVSLLMLGVYLGINAPSYGEDELTVSVSGEQAIEKSLQLAKENIERIGVEGINSTKATFVLDCYPHGTILPFRNTSVVHLYYVWRVEIQYDKYYGRPDGGRWVVGYAVTIRADTAEILYHGERW